MTIKYKSESNWYVVFINGSHNKTQQSHANELNISQQEIKQVIVIDALQCTVEHAATVTHSIQWIVSIVSLTVSQTLYRDTYRIAAPCIVAPLLYFIMGFPTPGKMVFILRHGSDAYVSKLPEHRSFTLYIACLWQAKMSLFGRSMTHLQAGGCLHAVFMDYRHSSSYMTVTVGTCQTHVALLRFMMMVKYVKSLAIDLTAGYSAYLHWKMSGQPSLQC